MNSGTRLDQPCVAVVLCTWQAGVHLEAQLASLAKQTWPIDVFVFDDASGDDTAERARRHPAVHAVIEQARNGGFVANFASGIAHVLSLDYDYIALADQDDHWHPDRVGSGMQVLLASERGTRACLVHSDLRMVDVDLREIHPSFLGWRRYRTGTRPDLPTALGQSGVMGNTVLFNRALARLALPFPPGLFVHDWWLGLAAELWGTRVFLDRATVDYRLHDSNTSNTLASTRPGRRSLLSGQTAKTIFSRDLKLPFKEDARVETLEMLLADDSPWQALSDDARHTIEEFVDYLRLRGSRTRLLTQTLRAGYFKPGLAHRLRVCYAMLTSTRYPREPRAR